MTDEPGNEPPKHEPASQTALTVGAATEQAVVTGAGAIGAAVLAPHGLAAVGSVLGAAAAKGLATLVRAVAEKHGRKRTEAFEAALVREVEGGSPGTLSEALEDDTFADAVFQNYRRAMDAVSPAVVESLARLTVAYQGREPDGFFRSLGRLVEELSGTEFEALRALVSAVVQVGGRLVNVLMWTTPNSTRELRIQRADVRGVEGEVFGASESDGMLRVLRLLERYDLDHDEHVSGTDLALVGRTVLSVQICRDIERIIGPVSVSVRPATFDRPPGYPATVVTTPRPPSP